MVRFTGAVLVSIALLGAGSPPTPLAAARVLDLQWQVGAGQATLVINVAGRPGLAVSPREEDALIVDILGARPVPGLVAPVPSGEGGVRGVHVRHHEGAPGFTRVTLELDGPVNHRARFDPLASAVLVDIGYQITRLAHEGQGAGARVIVEANGPVGCQVLLLESEGRLVVDLPGTTLAPSQPPGSLPVVNSAVRELRVLESATGVRVAVGFEGAPPHVLAGHRGLEISFAPRIRKVALATSVWGTPRLLVHTSAPAVIQETLELSPQMLTLEFPQAFLLDEVPTAQLTGSGMVEAVRVIGSPGGDPGVRLEVDLRLYGSHTLVWNQPGTLLMVEFHPPDLRGFIVAVDAGHGGYDPGALSRRGGIQEKDITLDLALRLGARLAEVGATVVHTRDRDVFLSNQERVALANRVGAHVLVSIHLNSYRDPSVRGLETYRARANAGGTELAEFIQAAVLEHTGLPDRGLRWEDFTVLVQAEMPAVMVEVLYLSSPTDASLAADPAFRDRVAEGMSVGLVRYFTAWRLRERR